MKKRWAALLSLSALLLGTALATSAAETGPTTTVGNTLYVSGVYGSVSDPAKQVDEVVQRAHEQLASQGLGIGAMVQHTIFVKEGAVSPGTVLQRFHAEATRLAPSLKVRKSVGTIIRVPNMPGNAAVMLELVAAAPAKKGAEDDFTRIPFNFGPQEIAETIRVGDLVYTAGIEAADFEHRTLPSGIDAQMEAVVGKLNAALNRAGLSMGDMIAHNLYVRKDIDPLRVIEKFHELTHKLAPQLEKKPSIGTLALVDGMAGNDFLIEMDAIASRAKNGAELQRVLFDRPMPIARSVSAGDFVFLSGDTGEVAGDDIDAQVDATARKIDATLRQAGLTIGDVVKARFYLKNGEGDPDKVRKRFHDAAVRLAPQLARRPYAETMLLVEGLDQPKAHVEIIVIASRRK